MKPRSSDPRLVKHGAAAGMGIFRPGFQKVVVTPSVCDVHTLFYEQWHDVFDIQTKLSGIIYVVFIFPVAQTRFRSRVFDPNHFKMSTVRARKTFKAYSRVMMKRKPSPPRRRRSLKILRVSLSSSTEPASPDTLWAFVDQQQYISGLEQRNKEARAAAKEAFLLELNSLYLWQLEQLPDDSAPGYSQAF